MCVCSEQRTYNKYFLVSGDVKEYLQHSAFFNFILPLLWLCVCIFVYEYGLLVVSVLNCTKFYRINL